MKYIFGKTQQISSPGLGIGSQVYSQSYQFQIPVIEQVKLTSFYSKAILVGGSAQQLPIIDGYCSLQVGSSDAVIPPLETVVSLGTEQDAQFLFPYNTVPKVDFKSRLSIKNKTTIILYLSLSFAALAAASTITWSFFLELESDKKNQFIVDLS